MRNVNGLYIIEKKQILVLPNRRKICVYVVNEIHASAALDSGGISAEHKRNEKKKNIDKYMCHNTKNSSNERSM